MKKVAKKSIQLADVSGRLDASEELLGRVCN